MVRLHYLLQKLALEDFAVDILDTIWYLYVGQSWIGTLTPTGADDSWYYAEFTEGDAWGNFAPWFIKAYKAYAAGDEQGWQNVYNQLYMMGLSLVAESGAAYENPTVLVDGGNAWFVV